MAESVYYVNGVTIATAATDLHAILQIWNGSGARTIELVDVGGFCFAAPAAGAGFVTRRSTARGTGSGTVTPTSEHHSRREAAPDSGFVVDFSTFSAQPTLAAGELAPCFVAPAVTACGIIVPLPRGVEIPPGTGLCLVNRAAIAWPASEIMLTVREL